MAECPKCGAKVKKDNLRRHINGVHGPSTQAPKAAPSAPERPASTVSFPWQIMVVLGVVAAIVIAGYWYMTQQPETNPPPPSGTVAVIETNYGTIKITLDMTQARRTSENFISLANADRYNGNSFHRVAANFVIQGGAVSGAATVAWENTGLRNVAYSVAMARSGDANDPGSRDTATSQFFISLKDNPSLDNYAYPYVVFGHVTEGKSVVDAIGAIPSNPTGDGQPISPVTIISVTIQT